MASPRFRGAVWLDELSHMRAVYGEAPVASGFETLCEADREALAHILPISWVAVEPVMACKNAIAEQVGLDPMALQRAVVRAGVERTVRGFWRLIVRQLWDDALAKRLPLLYSRTFEHGSLQVHSIGDGCASLRLSGWPNMHEYDCVGLATGIATIFDLAGRRNSQVRHRQERQGAETWFDVTWSKR